MIENIVKKIIKTYQNDRIVTDMNIDDMPLFNQIEIETVNRCNGECSFCPVNRHAPQRPYAIMDEELFYKIISELQAIDYHGEVCFSSNNEPFIDTRIESFIVYAHERLPNARLYMWTNGLIPQPDVIWRLSRIMDRIYIDNYSTDNEMYENIKNIYEYISDKDSGQIKIYNQLMLPTNTKISIFMRNSNEVLSTRGGQAPNKTAAKRVHSRCNRPFECMIIRPTGQVSLCCCDALEVYTMGDAAKQSIVDIWTKSDEYHQVRHSMQKKGRSELELCRDCDFR